MSFSNAIADSAAKGLQRCAPRCTSFPGASATGYEPDQGCGAEAVITECLQNFDERAWKFFRGSAGHEVRRINLYDMPSEVSKGTFAPLLSAQEREGYFMENNQPQLRNDPHVQFSVESLRWCDSLVLVYPTWWFNIPAILKVCHGMQSLAMQVLAVLTVAVLSLRPFYPVPSPFRPAGIFRPLLCAWGGLPLQQGAGQARDWAPEHPASRHPDNIRVQPGASGDIGRRWAENDLWWDEDAFCA